MPGYGSVKLRLTENRGACAQRNGRTGGRIFSAARFGDCGRNGCRCGGNSAARSTLKPIRRMIPVRGIKANDLSQRLHLPVAPDDPLLYQLGQTFNAFLHKLNLSFEQQRCFVADASHELKTPIAILEGHTHMIQRWGKKSPDVLDESLALMMNETGRMKEADRTASPACRSGRRLAGRSRGGKRSPGHAA